MVVFFVTVLLSARIIAADPAAALDAHLASHPGGGAAFTFDRADYEGDLSSLPIGVFDSGVGGLTVLEATLTLDAYHNDNLKPGADGRPDFEKERFLYLGDQANIPYGNYAAVGKLDYLRELILKDAVFLLGKRYHEGDSVRFDKPPAKALVIACNTATACGLDDIKSLVARLGIPVIVVGVVEAGPSGLLATETDPDGAIGVMATVGTCASEVYPRTIQSTLGRAGRGVATITQFGSPTLAAIIEGDPASRTGAAEQVRIDVRALVEAHRASAGGHAVKPLSAIVLGCTHSPPRARGDRRRFCRLEKRPRSRSLNCGAQAKQALNLFIRLADRYEEIMVYFEYGHVPYDNNQAERDLRMMKVREKISGTFRSDRHSKAFCDLRSVISNARKQSLPMLETLTALLRSPTQLGERLADAERT